MFVDTLAGLLVDPGLDGFRLDAPLWNRLAYRWQEGAGYRARWAVGTASELIALLHERARSVKPEALCFVETSIPMLATSTQLQYPYDELGTFEALRDGVLSAAEARRAFGYLPRIRLPGVAVAHTVDCHDTVWFREHGKRWTRELVGLARTRLSLALASLLDGAVMTFSGGEQGIEDWTRTLLTLRRELPALRPGRCDELAVDCDNDHMLPLWRE